MVEHFAPRAVEAAAGKVDPADDDREHVVEVVRDAAGQLPDRFHLLHLAKLGFGRFALFGLGLQRRVRLAELAGAVGDRLLEHFGALGFRFRQLLGVGELADGLDGDDSEEDRSHADDHAEPAEIVGQAVGLGREELGLLHPLAEQGALGGGDFGQLHRQVGARSADCAAW